MRSSIVKPKAIATYNLPYEHNFEEYWKLYEDGTTFQYAEETKCTNYYVEPDPENWEYKSYVDQYWGKYEDCPYKEQLKEIVLKKFQDGEIDSLPPWI